MGQFRQSISESCTENHTLADSLPVQSGILQQGVRLSQSKLWDILLNYYASQGINAWKNNVPTFITSSAYCADGYAEAVVAFLKDYYGRLDLSKPVYIVEMATGTGRFSFHLLRELECKLSCFSALQGIDLRYVMTDFTESNVQFWQSHIRLQPYIESGKLDFAVFNPLEEHALRLVVSGLELNSESMQNPLIAIGNYFFDSTPVDNFQVEDHCLQEGLVTLKRNLEVSTPESEPHISQIELEFEYRALPDPEYYEDAELNAILSHYCSVFEKGNLLFPIGAFDVVRNLRKLSNDRLVLLSSDKGFTNADKMMVRDRHDFSIHDGTFSYMVNYDALALYFHNRGGQAFKTVLPNLSIQTVCLVSMSESAQDYENMRYLFCEKIDRYNPINSLHNLMPEQNRQHEDQFFVNDKLLAEIRLQLSDPFVVMRMEDQVNQMMSNPCRVEQYRELICLFDLALKNYYCCPGEPNLPLYLATTFYKLKEYQRSLECWQILATIKGPDACLSFNTGCCYEKLGQFSEALTHYEMALQLQSDFQLAEEHLNNLRERWGIKFPSEQNGNSFRHLSSAKRNSMSQPRQSLNHLSAKKQNLSDSYHLVLSVSPAPTHPSLRDYLVE